jgi:protocatechuate 3,4-dioxygenase beta subunit
VGSDAASGPVMATPSCIVRPRQTVGPFPSKMKIERSDVRTEPGSMAQKPGLLLQVVFRVGQMAGGMCKSYEGVTVDFWQCDAGGVYSEYASEGTGTMRYLRGYQKTDSTGTAQFTSIFPGSYPGRAVHTHFSVITAGGKSFTSQLYFPEPVLSEIFAQAPYSAHKPMKNTSDSIFNDGGPNLIPKMTKMGAGWVAEFTIGLA